MNNIIRQKYIAETKASEENNRALVVTISTINPDRSNDVVMPQGIKLDNYLRNPVVMLGHDYRGLAIAKADQIEVKDDRIVARVQFPPEKDYPLADTVYNLYSKGFMNAWSIGFIPTKALDLENGGRQFEEWELLEFSAVAVPDNPEALTMLRSKGIDMTPIEKVIADTKEGGELEEDTKEEEKPEEPVSSSEVIAEDKPEDQPVEQEAKVLSTKSRELISKAIGSMNETIKVLEELASTSEEVEEVPTKANQTVLDLVEGLKIADKAIGLALKRAKAR